MSTFLNHRSLPERGCVDRKGKFSPPSILLSLLGILALPRLLAAAEAPAPNGPVIDLDATAPENAGPATPPRAGEDLPPQPPPLPPGMMKAGTGQSQSPGAPAPGSPAPDATIYIRQYKVLGAKNLPKIDIERAVYPYLGPGRTPEDVEQARAALEKAYHDKGFQAVSVQIPPQDDRTVRKGIIALQVNPTPVGRLRVTGSRYFLPSDIKAGAPSMAPGAMVNFNDVNRDILALNQYPDRRITPSLQPGVLPGTVDIELKVEDTFPLHGNAELNNRYSPNTTELRVNGGVSYSNLWQLGHTIGMSFQISPQDLDEVQVFNGYYLAHVPGIEWLNFLVQGTSNNSNVSTLGGAATAGRGTTIGGRAIFTLPAGKDFYHSVSLGLDYKDYEQELSIAGDTTTTPVTYYPLSAAYSATWAFPGSRTELNADLVVNPRGLGSSTAEFDLSRFNSDGSFLYLRGDLSHLHDLPWGFQAFGRLQGQVTADALVTNEQFAAGGLDTVRGYLEAEVLGDNAALGTIELRTPSLLDLLGYEKSGDWRVYGFVDGGIVSLNDPLPEQISNFDLASFGVGTRVSLLEHFHGSLDLGIPLITQTYTNAHSLMLTFRFWMDF